MNNYLSINDKNNIIFDFVYTSNSKKCLLNSNINIDNININDIKISICDKEYYDIIKNDILNAKYKFISYNDNYILLKRYSDNLSLNAKISFYEKDDINNIKVSVNNDSLYSYLLSNLVLLNKTPHILLPIINFDILFENVYSIIPDEIIKVINKKYINNNLICCIQLRECYFKTYNLKEYLDLQNNCVKIKPLLFQIIYTLAIINNEYPHFKHNNISFKSIFLYIKKNQEKTIYKGFKNDNFILDDNDYDIKLTNFEKVSFNNNNNNDLQILFTELSNYKFCDDETSIFIKKKYNNYIDMLYDDYFNNYNHNNNNNNNNNNNQYKGITYGNIISSNKKLSNDIKNEKISNDKNKKISNDKNKKISIDKNKNKKISIDKNKNKKISIDKNKKLLNDKKKKNIKR